MKKILFGLIFIGIIIVAAITCPNKDNHSEKLAQVVNASLKETVSKHAGNGIGALSSIVTGPLVKGAVGEIIDVDNYVVVSIGKIKLPTETKIVSVGLFNNIITVETEDLTKAIEEEAGSAINNIFK